MIPIAIMLLQDAYYRAQRLRHTERDERGASVLEWALIAAVVVVAASIIGAVIINIVTRKSTELDHCADQVGGTACGK
jgi:Flp pilus assembly pilin Flp